MIQSLIFIPLLLIGGVLIFHRPVAGTILTGVFLFAFYVPMIYWINRMMWRRRERTRMKDG